MKRKSAIIAYDIVDDSRRRRIHRKLQAWKLDGQFSVVECVLSDQEAEELYTQLQHHIDPNEDKLILMWVDSERQCQALTQATQVSFKQPLLHIAS